MQFLLCCEWLLGPKFWSTLIIIKKKKDGDMIFLSSLCKERQLHNLTSCGFELQCMFNSWLVSWFVDGCMQRIVDEELNQKSIFIFSADVEDKTPSLSLENKGITIYIHTHMQLLVEWLQTFPVAFNKKCAHTHTLRLYTFNSWDSSVKVTHLLSKLHLPSLSLSPSLCCRRNQ